MRPLTTQRLILRPFTDDDIDIHRVVFSDPKVCYYYCRNTRTLEEVREWLIHRRWQSKAEDELGFLAVIRKADQQILGLVALQLFAIRDLQIAGDPASPFTTLAVELSYAFGQEFQGQGYATEACEVLIEDGFRYMRLPRLVNAIDPENIASVRLAERLGFRRVETLGPEGFGPVWVRDNELLETNANSA